MMIDLLGPGLDALLKAHPGLRLAPSPDESIRIVGRVRCVATNAGLEPLELSYELSVSVPPGFPKEVPLVWETGGRIPDNFHRNPGGTLCLGSPTAVKLMTMEAVSIDMFFESLVIPFLYERSYFERYERMPFGELEHGQKGVVRDFMERFGVGDEKAAVSMVRLASLRKRVANKQPCPCGAVKKLGSCGHHLNVNRLRKKLGRTWFAAQHLQLLKPQ